MERNYSEAIFSNIAQRISSEIDKANNSIYIAVAWFTNKFLLNKLIAKSKSGCLIYLIVSNDNINQSAFKEINFSAIENFRIYKVGNGDSELMHNKFCIVDSSTIITGSYNWSYKAEKNFENVIITYRDVVLAKQFINEFIKIVAKYYPDNTEFKSKLPLDIIIKRLEIIKNYILLDELEEATLGANKLIEFHFDLQLNTIIESVSKKNYIDAIKYIQEFITKNQAITIFLDPEVEVLKLKIKNLEIKLNAFDNEKIELEKTITEFHYRHTIELGEIILEILGLKKLKFKANKIKFEEAECDEHNYKEQLITEQEKDIYHLSDDFKIELKKKFRKATILCHPDKVSEEFTETAQEIFIELKNAYDLNDLVKVTQIFDELETGNYFKAKSETINEKELLLAAIVKLERKIKIIESEIVSIKENDAFQIIISISNWDEYFNLTKEKLKMELNELKMEINYA